MSSPPSNSTHMKNTAKMKISLKKTPENEEDLKSKMTSKYKDDIRNKYRQMLRLHLYSNLWFTAHLSFPTKKLILLLLKFWACLIEDTGLTDFQVLGFLRVNYQEVP